MAAGFSLETHPWCASFAVQCNGDRIIRIVHHPDGIVSFDTAPPTAAGSIVRGGIIRMRW